MAQALLEAYKREDNHECLCKGCGNRLLIADAAPSWDALSPKQHEEINMIVARLAEPYLKREEEDDYAHQQLQEERRITAKLYDQIKRMEEAALLQGKESK